MSVTGTGAKVPPYRRVFSTRVRPFAHWSFGELSDKQRHCQPQLIRLEGNGINSVAVPPFGAAYGLSPRLIYREHFAR